jgi:nucleotide-binding universal stress UspA family protein
MSAAAPYPCIIVGTDGSVTAGRAARSAALLADRLRAPLFIAAAFQRTRPQDLGPMSDRAGGGEDVLSTGYRAAAEVAQDACGQATRGLQVQVDTAAIEGDPADALLAMAERHAGALLVVGNKGMTDSSRFLLGSVPNKVTHHAVGDVLVVRTDAQHSERVPERLVVGTDGSRTANRAVQRAVDLAAGLGAHLTVLSVGERDLTEGALAAARPMAEAAGIAVEEQARPGDPATELLEAAAEHDLLVVGNRGMTGAARFLMGSVPNKVSHSVTTDLLIVKTD